MTSFPRLSRGQLVLTTGVVIVVVLLAGLFVSSMSYRTGVKDIPTTFASTLTYEIADTPAKQELGLGNRAMIADNYSMLFVFTKSDRYGFWMKDMLTSIDMIWLSDNGTVIAVDSDVSPDTYPHIFYPPAPVRYVVETRANFASDRGIVAGTHLPLPQPYGTGK